MLLLDFKSGLVLAPKLKSGGSIVRLFMFPATEKYVNFTIFCCALYQVEHEDASERQRATF
jgi:hypothetical protein